MRYVEPEVFLIAETAVDRTGMENFLRAIGAPSNWGTDAPSDAEELIEVAGRYCYKSFGTDLNSNVTRTREGNQPYIKNILEVKHGSVAEHPDVTMAIIGVSRVFTHELVRHRAGTAFSQESLRFVRLDELTAYYPRAFEADTIFKLLMNATDETPDWCKEEADDKAFWLEQKFTEVFEYLENTQKEIAEELMLDEVDDFNLKKRVTSAMRRLAPIGLGTGIIITGNHRTWRHILEMRAAGPAEEEINLVTGAVGKILKDKFPNIYQDVKLFHDSSGAYDIEVENSKI